MICIAKNLMMILYKNTIVDNGNKSWLGELACSIKAWRCVEDIVRLPLGWFTCGINHWRLLAVDGASLAIRIGWVLKAVEDLNFVLS